MSSIELNERPMKFREMAGHDDEAGARDAAGGLEVHAEARADDHMVLGLELERARRSPAPDLEIVGLVATGGTLACSMFGIPSCTSETCACIRSSSASSP